MIDFVRYFMHIALNIIRVRVHGVARDGWEGEGTGEGPGERARGGG